MVHLQWTDRDNADLIKHTTKYVAGNIGALNPFKLLLRLNTGFEKVLYRKMSKKKSSKHQWTKQLGIKHTK